MLQLDQFELDRDPFRASQGVVLATAPLRAAIERIRTDLGVGATALRVQAAHGFGKTCLARALPAALGRSTALAGIALVPDPTHEWLEIRQSITCQLGLPGDVLSARSLAIACANSRRLVIVVDRADEASEEFFAHLDVLMAYRPMDAESYFQVVLLARPESPEAPSPLSRWVASSRHVEIELDPLSVHGVQGYIKQQLLHAGRSTASLFTVDACRAIHRVTAGIPGRVNDVCSQSLEAASGRRFTELGSEFVEDVVARTHEAPTHQTVEVQNMIPEVAEEVCEKIQEPVAGTVSVRRPRPRAEESANVIVRAFGAAAVVLALASLALR